MSLEEEGLMYRPEKQQEPEQSKLEIITKIGSMAYKILKFIPKLNYIPKVMAEKGCNREDLAMGVIIGTFANAGIYGGIMLANSYHKFLNSYVEKAIPWVMVSAITANVISGLYESGKMIRPIYKYPSHLRLKHKTKKE
ncbi:hypothetical protein KW805_02130 [Candidatus Pacearchaeota archaeon]|nr:hypothetical protein [Candidatus Pacearchaeota archaeon]